MARRPVPVEALLGALPLFRELDPAAIARLAAAAERRPLARGEAAFRRGDRPLGLWVVVYGEIRLVARTPARGARLTGVVTAGKSFGEPVMFLDRPALVDAEAAGDALVLLVPKAAVYAELEHNPRFARRIIAGLARRIEALVAEIALLSEGTALQRVVAYLLRGAPEGALEHAVTLPAAKAAVATQLNLTPEHFSRLLHELADHGLLRVAGRRLVVPDAAKLAAHARGRRRRGSAG